MAIVEVLIELAKRFGQIIASPVKNTEMLWIIVPIYISWVLADYYQEKKGTDFGNALSNGFVTMWVGVDWTKQIVSGGWSEISATKIIVSIIFVAYGLLIMIESARGKKIAHYIGRVREVSYFMIVATPIYYKVVPVDIITIGAILLFFPVFYFIAELIDRILPAPPGDEDEMKDIDSTKTMDLGASTSDMSASAGTDTGMNNFGQTSAPQQSYGQPQQYPQGNYGNAPPM